MISKKKFKNKRSAEPAEPKNRNSNTEKARANDSFSILHTTPRIQGSLETGFNSGNDILQVNI